MGTVLKGADGTVYQTGGLIDHILPSLSRTLIMERYPHPPDASLDSPDSSRKFATLTNASVMSSALQGSDGASPGGGQVRVIPVAERDDLRLFALSLIAQKSFIGSGDMRVPIIVLRNAACLSCCLRQCRDAGVYILIL